MSAGSRNTINSLSFVKRRVDFYGGGGGCVGDGTITALATTAVAGAGAGAAHAAARQLIGTSHFGSRETCSNVRAAVRPPGVCDDAMTTTILSRLYPRRAGSDGAVAAVVAPAVFFFFF